VATARILPADEGIAGAQAGETTKVAVGRPQLAHAVAPADRCHPGVVDPRSHRAAHLEQVAQVGPVAHRLGQYDETGRLRPAALVGELAKTLPRRRHVRL